MNLGSILGEMSKEDFLDRHFHKLPFSSVGTASSARELGTWNTVTTVIANDDADVMVVRDGQQFTGPTPKTRDDAIGLSQEGYTILVRHAERHHDELRALARSFRTDLHSPVDIHIYATPPGKHGFSWHYDAEDVFILQTTGEKEYSLRKNTVNPWPLVETIPNDMRYEREITPLMRVLLKAGDWLYIPCGYWHKAETPDTDETAISLAIGVMSRSAIQLYDFLRPRLLDSLVWRQRLPIVSNVQETNSDRTCSTHTIDGFEQIREQLIADFARSVQDPALQSEFIEWLRGDQEDVNS